jgi:hypothetical protein
VCEGQTWQRAKRREKKHKKQKSKKKSEKRQKRETQEFFFQRHKSASSFFALSLSLEKIHHFERRLIRTHQEDFTKTL